MKKLYPVSKNAVQQTHLTADEYTVLYNESLLQPTQFWERQASQFLSWSKPWDHVMQGDFSQGNIRWFEGGELNVCVNCLDRHLPENADKLALIWESDDGLQTRKLSYADLFEAVCRCANVLIQLQIKAGDRVAIYLPMIPEAVVAMLACARIGAIHSVIFAGFSPQAVRDRINDADCSLVITADFGLRGGKTISLKHNIDLALIDCPSVRHVLVVEHTGQSIVWQKPRDLAWQACMSQAAAQHQPLYFSAEQALFILYTSGSTGKPKGILHTSAGYLLYAACTFYYVFDYHADDLFWCTADVGWITGHTYLVYGPLANAATIFMFEGIPTYPTASRYWELVDKYKINILYTAPTVLRSLMREGDLYLKTTHRDSLKLLGSVGEPINPEVWEWYYHAVGKARCPIVDTWWQTETGGIMISALPGVMVLKPGSACKPFFGIQPKIIDDKGNVLINHETGNLVISSSWPGQARTLYGDHARYLKTYFNSFPNLYTTGDGARCDEDGYYWITGRVDDVINVSGHRIGSAEVENALLEDSNVAEAAVVGFPHEVKGQGLYAFVTLKINVMPSLALKNNLNKTVREIIGPIATLDKIQLTASLPKTRSGKIMRRILRKIAAGEVNELGDTSTLADPNVINVLIEEAKNL